MYIVYPFFYPKSNNLLESDLGKVLPFFICKIEHKYIFSLQSGGAFIISLARPPQNAMCIIRVRSFLATCTLPG